MSKKQFEDNLNYGDAFNYFWSLFSSVVANDEEKHLTEVKI